MLSAEKMKFLRQLHNLSQKDIGDYMGVSKNYISMIENRKHPYSKEQHDKYINAIYAVSTAKKKQKEDTTEILDDVKEVEENNKDKEVENVEEVQKSDKKSSKKTTK
ncbi:helix-turn-helix transcriptional regulator [Clostridium sp. JN-1]|uniref:helix-turn-helix domain-containing protein n=1 Tax=Clostridium sp. JN-1 TaxID=2483110 RepID=UPI000F0B694F|nr:helix-turn-helix transcriptional regulator [Clostridium sp. JN-1]